jgi:hypothetical protein
VNTYIYHKMMKYWSHTKRQEKKISFIKAEQFLVDKILNEIDSINTSNLRFRKNVLFFWLSQNHHFDSYELDCKHFWKSTFVNSWFFRKYNNILINFEILFLFQRYKSVSIISRFYFFLRHKCNSIRNSNFIFTVLFRYRNQRLIVDVSLFLKSKSVQNAKQININFWIFEFFSSTMNDGRIFFKIIMLILNSNNFLLWIKELKDLILKIKIWKYINSYDKTEKSRKKILSKISHFVVK